MSLQSANTPSFFWEQKRTSMGSISSMSGCSCSLTFSRYIRFGVTLKQAMKSSTRYLAVSFSESSLRRFKLDGKKASINVFIMQSDKLLWYIGVPAWHDGFEKGHQFRFEIFSCAIQDDMVRYSIYHQIMCLMIYRTKFVIKPCLLSKRADVLFLSKLQWFINTYIK